MNIKRSLLIPLLLFISVLPGHAIEQKHVVMSKVPPPPITARSWLLVDHDSGAVLASGNPDTRVEPASLTKLMTAYIVFRELAEGRRTLDEMVYISEKAWRMEGSRMFARVNSRIRLEDLIKGMIIQSGNDATVALAEHIGGSEESFVGLMNQTAAELDMSGTHFMNSSGMPGAEHFTTATDLARLTRALIHDYPEYYRYYAIQDFTWNNIKQGNRNILLARDASVDGVKTGHTESAGYCLIGSAMRDDMRLLAVVIGADSKLARADLVHSLLNYGFANYITREIYPAGKMVQNITVYKGVADSVAAQTSEAIYLTVPRRESDEITQTVTVPDYVIAPVTGGQPLGDISFTVAGREVGVYPLTAVSGVEEGGIIDQLIGTVMLWFE
jgi:D-alanyl-D-alanine carboxypeptidase (penicillin-binding protein 5/6)